MADLVDGVAEIDTLLRDSKVSPQSEELIEQWLRTVDHGNKSLVSNIKNCPYGQIPVDFIKHEGVEPQAYDRRYNDDSIHANTTQNPLRPDRLHDTGFQSSPIILRPDIGTKVTKYTLKPEAFPSSNQTNQQEHLLLASSHLSPFSNACVPNPTDRVEFDSTNSPSKRYARRQRHKAKPDKYEYKGDVKTVGEIRTEKANVKRHKKCKKSGTALNSEFQAPNVEPERITLQQDTKRGNFSRSKVTTAIEDHDLPDLTFTEMAFLSRRKRQHYGGSPHAEIMTQDQLSENNQPLRTLKNSSTLDKCDYLAGVTCENRSSGMFGCDPGAGQFSREYFTEPKSRSSKTPLLIKPLLDGRPRSPLQQVVHNNTNSRATAAQSKLFSSFTWSLSPGSEKRGKFRVVLQQPSGTKQTMTQVVDNTQDLSLISLLAFEEYTRNALIRNQPGVWRRSKDTDDDMSICSPLQELKNLATTINPLEKNNKTTGDFSPGCAIQNGYDDRNLWQLNEFLRVDAEPYAGQILPETSMQRFQGGSDCLDSGGRLASHLTNQKGKTERNLEKKLNDELVGKPVFSCDHIENLPVLYGEEVDPQEMDTPCVSQPKHFDVDAHAYGYQAGLTYRNYHDFEAVSHSVDSSVQFNERDLANFRKTSLRGNLTSHQEEWGPNRLLQTNKVKVDRTLPETGVRQRNDLSHVKNYPSLLPSALECLSSRTIHPLTMRSQFWTDKRFQMELPIEFRNNSNAMQRSFSDRSADAWSRVCEDQDQPIFTGFDRPYLLY